MVLLTPIRVCINTCLPYGETSTIFMETVLNGIRNVVVDIDNVLVTGENDAVHHRNLTEVLKWLLEWVL